MAAWYYTKARRLQHDIRPRPQKLSLEPIVLMRQEKITCTFRGMLKKPTKPTIKNYIKIRWKGNFIRKKKKGCTERTMTRLKHVDKGKLCIKSKCGLSILFVRYSNLLDPLHFEYLHCFSISSVKLCLQNMWTFEIGTPL